jgi:two-component system response regulator AtoC
VSRILIIEDDAAVRGNILDLLEAEGFEGLAAEDGEAGVELALRQLPDLIICDVSMPGIDGYEVFELLSARPSTAVIPFMFLSARAERADVRRGMALGADDYVTKPFTRHELLDSIRARLRKRATSPAVAFSASGQAPAPIALEPSVLVSDPAMQALFAQIERLAQGTISILILGETGVGKEVVAEQIHRRSQRKGRFIPINCAALSEGLLESELFGHERGAFTGADRAKEGLFEAADGGTIFLDEVGELPSSTQVKLLRVLEDRKVMRVGGRTSRNIDVRFLSATNRDVERDVERGGFRQDLYYRLNGITLDVPPLRQRRADITGLAMLFLTETSRSLQRPAALRLSADALDALLSYAWPGNIRELRNVMERAALLCDGPEVLPAHLPGKMTEVGVTETVTPSPSVLGPGPGPSLAPHQPLDARDRLIDQMERLERERIVETLARCGGNQTQAAEQLGISRRTLVTRLNQYDLPRPRKAH